MPPCEAWALRLASVFLHLPTAFSFRRWEPHRRAERLSLAGKSPLNSKVLDLTAHFEMPLRNMHKFYKVTESFLSPITSVTSNYELIRYHS